MPAKKCLLVKKAGCLRLVLRTGNVYWLVKVVEEKGEQERVMVVIS
jgi:hypothetical protein